MLIDHGKKQCEFMNFSYAGILGKYEGIADLSQTNRRANNSYIFVSVSLLPSLLNSKSKILEKKRRKKKREREFVRCKT